VRIFPSQKYSLQKKNSAGFFVRVATFDDPVSQEAVFKEFGPGYYILRSTKPRFSTQWKGSLGPPPEETQVESKKIQLSIQRLERKTNAIAVGVVATAIGELVGFPLTHLRFVGIEEKLDQVVGVLQTLPANGLECPTCKTALDYMLQPSCNSCGTPLTWPKNLRPTSTLIQQVRFVGVQ
jgi:hypothetical protein